MASRREFLKSLGITVDTSLKRESFGVDFPELTESSTKAHKTIGSKFNPQIGTVTAILGDKAPPGWVFCDGAQAEIRDFPDLFLFLGDTYGESYGWDGKAMTFRIPEYKVIDGAVPMEKYIIKAQI